MRRQPAENQPAPGQPDQAPPAETQRLARVTSSMNSIKPAAFGYEQARHLLWRAGFGGTPQQIQALVAMGPQKAVDYIVDYDKVEFERPRSDLFSREIMRPPTAEEREAYRKAAQAKDEDTLAKLRQVRQQREGEDRRQMVEIQKWWLKRMIQTPRPLEEKMTLFWHGLLATSYRTIENSFHMFKQNMMFRANAVGNYGKMLFELIRDPAMIAYLNNNDSRKGKPNENLAREIMELFSLGQGNYTEKDIKEGARALTGYTFRDDEFYFDARNHDDGQKTILGKSGQFDGDGFVRAILENRKCSAYMARRLYGYFVAELPPVERAADADLDPAVRSVLSSLASTMLASKYDIGPVLKKLFLSEHFYDPRNMGEQIKSPVTLIVGAVRSLDTPVRDLGILNDALDLMGQSLFFPPSVKGWEGGRSWINTSTLFVRQNILTFLLTGKKPIGYDPSATVEKFDPMPLLAELNAADSTSAGRADATVDYLLKLTIGRTPERAREPLLRFLAPRQGAITPDMVTGLLLLITAMPEYQLC